MAAWAAKRFWEEVHLETVPGGYGVRLDTRPVKTPGKLALVVPTLALAEAVAAEWRAQVGLIDPRGMPFTRSVNAAIDKVAAQKAEVVDIIAAYGDADLLCYRAEGPARLVARQAAAWDPLLDWAATWGAQMRVAAGVIHVPQDAGVLAVLRGRVAAMDAFALTGFHDLVAMSGSLIIGLAVTEGQDVEALWQASRIDENWQAEVWGADEEAEAAAALKHADFLHAAEFYRLSRENVGFA